MGSRKDELSKAKESGESSVASKFGSKSTGNSARDDMFTMTYEDAKEKYGSGPGSIKYFMSKSDFEKGKAKWESEQASTHADLPSQRPQAGEMAKSFTPEKSGSLVANQFADKPKTWADVKAEQGNDPAKIAEYLNNNPEYKAGDLTKAGMAEMGYKQSEDGKWTIDQVLDSIDELSNDDPAIGKMVDSLTNPETGDVEEDKAKKAVSDYEMKLVEKGAGEFDEEGNFHLTNTTGRGWETWATMLSVGLSVIGIAMGVPIIPINFRAITGRDTRDAQINALQQQYMNIKAGAAETVSNMGADVEAGEIAKNNKDALRAQEEHAQNMGAYKTKSDIDSDSKLQEINAQQAAEYKKLQAQLNSNEKIASMQLQHAKEMAQLQSDLSTKSAKELTEYSKAGWVVDYINECKRQGMSNKEIALAVSGINGTTPTQKGLQNAEQIVGMVTKTVDSAAGVVDAVMPDSLF